MFPLRRAHTVARIIVQLVGRGSGFLHTRRDPEWGCTPKPPKIPSRSRTTSESPGADAVVVFMADPAVSGNTCLATGQ